MHTGTCAIQKVQKVWTPLRNFLHIAPTVLGTWRTCICSHEYAMQGISDAFQRPVCEISEKSGASLPYWPSVCQPTTYRYRNLWYAV